MKIKNNVALVTGAASGLGEATVRMLAKDGCRFSLLDLDEKKGEALASELGDAAVFCKTDVTDDDAVQKAVDKTMKKFSAIHMVVHCAGIGIPEKVLGKKGTLSMDSFRKVVAVNVFGTMNVVRLAAAAMIKNEPWEDNERGVIITTSSAAAFDGQIGQASYSASKAAIVGMTLPIAREFAEYGIRVNNIAPGLFNTPLLNQLPDEILTALGNTVPFPKRLGYPVEFAMLARQIIQNTMINGETLRLDGALRMTAK